MDPVCFSFLFNYTQSFPWGSFPSHIWLLSGLPFSSLNFSWCIQTQIHILSVFKFLLHIPLGKQSEDNTRTNTGAFGVLRNLTKFIVSLYMVCSPCCCDFYTKRHIGFKVFSQCFLQFPFPSDAFLSLTLKTRFSTKHLLPGWKKRWDPGQKHIEIKHVHSYAH